MKSNTNTKTKTIATATKTIKELINIGDLKKAYKIIQEFMLKYPEDTYLKYQLVRINLLNQNYEESLDLLEELDEETNFIIKTELYLKLQREQEEFYMYQKYFTKLRKNNPILRKRYKRYLNLYIYLNKKYNPNFKLPKELELSYLETQIYSYSKETVIENINKNHYDLENTERGVFYSNINIEELYNFADQYIKNNNLIGTLKFGTEVYHFYYPNCGLLRTREKANGFTVVTALGSKNIIAIYPNLVTNFSNIIRYDYPTVEPKKLVKTKSGLERFNARYNK